MSLTNGCTIGEDEFGKNSKEVHEKKNVGKKILEHGRFTFLVRPYEGQRLLSWSYLPLTFRMVLRLVLRLEDKWLGNLLSR